MFLCIIALCGIRLCFYHQPQPQLGVVFFFPFGSVSSFFLELFLQWSPVAYWAPSNLGSSSFSVLSLSLFILFLEVSRQEYWSGLPFPSPVDHIFSELSTMTYLSWVDLHSIAFSFTELDKVVVHVIWLVTFLWLWFLVCLPSDGEGRGLWKFHDGKDWLREKLDLFLMRRSSSVNL